MLSLSSGAVEILDNVVIKVMHPHPSGSFSKLTLNPALTPPEPNESESLGGTPAHRFRKSLQWQF